MSPRIAQPALSARIARRKAAQAGFTLLEILIAMAILAFALAVISSSSSTSAIYSKRVYRSTAAALLLRGVVLDIEEEYRKDGFPTNDIEGKDCELPKAYARQFDCEYDLVGLNLDAAAISEMTQNSQDLLGQAQEQLQDSGALDKLNASKSAPKPKDPGAEALKDLDGAATGAKKAGLDLSSLTKGGDMMTLIQTILMSGEQGLNLLGLCDINIAILQMSMGLMIGELLPRILKRATDRTRKIRVRLSWTDAEGEDRTLGIESFTTAVSEEEARMVQQVKDQMAMAEAVQAQRDANKPQPRARPRGR
ncbi:MAG: type II secretion system protein [Myxococcales bacterium]|nr:type II secretion system protein [Myxococcales bacterium]